jgi:Xaa-Pro aminopeptidase
MMPPLEISGRCQRVRERFDQAEALLISDLINIRWLTGFTGSNGWVLLAPQEVVLVTDGRYGDQAMA